MFMVVFLVSMGRVKVLTLFLVSVGGVKSS